MTVSLRPISKEELDEFLIMSVDAYAQSMVDNGEYSDRSTPDRLSREEVYSYFPDGKLRPGEYINSIVRDEDDQVLGTIWVTLYPRPGGHQSAFLVWIDIAEAFRRQGYAREAIKTLESWLRRKQVHVIDLSVFANNHGARKLYHDLGYQETRAKTYGQATEPTRFEMRKHLVALNVLAR